jgi:hypothetical protein
MVAQGLIERHALRVVRMSAAALRYVPRPDPDPGRATVSSPWPTATDGTAPA